MSITLLISRICALFIMMLAGAMLVRTGICKSEDSRVLSEVSVYLVIPCSMLASFQVEYSKDVLDGLVLACFAAVVILLMVILIMHVLGKKLNLNGVERASVIYSNAGNLVIPLVSSLLGSEWVIYCSAYVSVMTILIWSHGKMIICGEKKPDLKKIFLSINMVAIYIGIITFLLKIKYPSSLGTAIDSIGNMVGPMAMFVTGMLNANARIKEIISYPKIWLVVGLRLVFVPCLTLLFLKYSGIAAFAEHGTKILMITLIATITPSASNVVQIAQVYGKDATYAGAINVLTTLMCLITMPVMIYLYQM
jgi:malate permease and related proteins